MSWMSAIAENQQHPWFLPALLTITGSAVARHRASDETRLPTTASILFAGGKIPSGCHGRSLPDAMADLDAAIRRVISETDRVLAAIDAASTIDGAAGRSAFGSSLMDQRSDTLVESVLRRCVTDSVCACLDEQSAYGAFAQAHIVAGASNEWLEAGLDIESFDWLSVVDAVNGLMTSLGYVMEISPSDRLLGYRLPLASAA